MKHTVVIEKLIKNGKARRVIVDGITYSSMNNMRMSLGLSETEINKYKKSGLSYENAILKVLDNKDKRNEKRRLRMTKVNHNKDEIYYNGLTYRNLKIACQEVNEKFGRIGLHKDYVLRKAKERGLSKQDAFNYSVYILLHRYYRRMTESKRKYGIFSTLTLKETGEILKLYLNKSGLDDMNDVRYINFVAKETGLKPKYVRELVDEYTYFGKYI